MDRTVKKYQISYLSRLVRLSHSGTTPAEDVASKLRALGLDNVFNPSLLNNADRTLIAFRAFGPTRCYPFHAYLLELSDGGISCIDLTSYVSHFGIATVADPKLLTLSGQSWVTFNTGSSRTGNRLYLMPLAPEPGRPLECLFSGRRKIEKNWGFFEFDKALHALYSVDPLCLLRVTEHNEASGTLRFERLPSVMSPRQSCTEQRMRLTIGTQPVMEDNRLYLIAHQKIRFLGKRSYFGRPVMVDHIVDAPRLRASRTILIHSLRSLIGARPRHNPNLISCTYFSGLSLDPIHATIAYGVNDVDFDIRFIKRTCLW